jgi:hypothetical protein
LVRFDLVSPAGPDGRPGAPPIDARLAVLSLAQRGPDAPVLGPAQLGDIARWRADIAGLGLAWAPPTAR